MLQNTGNYLSHTMICCLLSINVETFFLHEVEKYQAALKKTNQTIQYLFAKFSKDVGCSEERFFRRALL